MDDLALEPYSRASGPLTIPPLACARPVDEDDVATLLSWALDEGVPLIPRGAGTGMPGGNVGSGVTLDLSAGFTEVGPVRKDDRTIRVAAGAVAAHVERAARSAGLFVPPLPSSAARCTVGGMVANNAAGARTFKYGAVREWVRELEVMTPDGCRHRLERDDGASDAFGPLLRTLQGDIATPISWPRVRKNSSGYALDRFMLRGDAVDLLVGSEGTLGVVTAATLELARIPDSTAVAWISIEDVEDIARVLDAIAPLGASACEFFGRRFLQLASRSHRPGPALAEAWGGFLIELDGCAESVASGMDALRRLGKTLGSKTLTAVDEEGCRTLWELRHAASPLIADGAARGLLSTQLIEDSVVPPSCLGRYLTRLDGILTRWETDAVVFGHAGDANIHVNLLLDVTRPRWRERARGILEDTADLVADLGGTLSGEHGDGRMRAPLLERIWGPSLTAAFGTVKRTLDPAGILNPGVILPLPGQDPLDGLWARWDLSS